MVCATALTDLITLLCDLSIPGCQIFRIMVQQIGDDSRGWAWTRALQGLAANEIHMCGDGSALPLVRTLAQQMGEELEVCISPTSFSWGEISYSMPVVLRIYACNVRVPA